MAEVTLFWCPQCGRCRHLLPHQIEDRVRCIACDTFFPHDGRLFGQIAWKMTTDLERMAAALSELGRDLSERKWRLLACAIARIEFDWCRNPWFREAVNCAEGWADTGEPLRGTTECATHFAQVSSEPRDSRWSRNSREWVGLARRMLRDDPRPRRADQPQWSALSSSLLREFVPNPFVPVEWNPDWSTSTVCDLARAMYASRDFSGMPILADALQDADCNDKRVLNHCRTEKLHARGCWVLDAILGKT